MEQKRDPPTREDVSKLRVQTAVPDDFRAIEQLCESVHFDIGAHNLKLYFDTSPTKWSVIYDKHNQLIGVDARNKLADDLVYGYMVIVRSEWRGLGLSKLISPTNHDPGVMGSATKEAIEKFRHYDMTWLEKRLSFFGYCQRSQIAQLPDIPILNAELEPICSRNFDRLAEFDRQILQLDRREFVRSWSMPDDRKFGFSVGAFDLESGRCIGYGTLRLFSYYYGIQPLYADTPEIATAITTRLLKMHNDNINLYLPAMADKPAVVAVSHLLRLTCTGTEFRQADVFAKRNYVPKLLMHKVYTVHEYYPV